MRVDPRNAGLYLGEIANAVCRSGGTMRARLASRQPRDGALTFLISCSKGTITERELPIDRLDWLEIDGPRHPKDKAPAG